MREAGASPRLDLGEGEEVGGEGDGPEDSERPGGPVMQAELPFVAGPIPLHPRHEVAWSTQPNRWRSGERVDIAGTAEVVALEAARPVKRADCIAGPRPCPFLSCRHHLAIEVTDSGTLYIQNDWDDGRATCSLDVADQTIEGLTLESMGKMFGITRERVRQIEVGAAAKARRRGLRVFIDRLDGVKP